MNILQKILLKSFKEYRNKNAIHVNGKFYKYKDIFKMSLRVVADLKKKNSNIVGIFNDKNVYCYVSILGVFFSNNIFVPLNKNFSNQKNKHMIETSGIDTIITDIKNKNLLKKIIKKNNYITLSPSFFKKKIIDIKFSQSNLNDVCYILFTSGSSGNPKGVPIKNKNLSNYIKNIKKRFKYSYKDKFSNNFEITFDLFLHDLFTCWSSGACLYVPDKNYFFNPSLFIKKHKLTCWFSVPSLVYNMMKAKQLKKNNFLSLKYSAFCGEALSENIVKKWLTSSPNTVIDNLYGPTETTISIMAYRWKNLCSSKQSKNGIVSIGKIFPENLIKFSKKKIFELLISGKQVFEGYLNNKNKNLEIFHNSNHNYYKTGDLVSKDRHGNFFYHGRKDRQIKVGGYRIEPQEVENAIKKLIPSEENVVVLGYPKLNLNQLSYDSLVAFLTCSQKKISDNKILNNLRKSLSDYQIPKKLIRIKNFKFNSNGKIDYNDLHKKIR